MPPTDVLPAQRDNAVQILRQKLLPLLDNNQVKADQYARKTEQMVFDSCNTFQQWGHVLAHKLKGLDEKLTQKYAAAQQQQQQQQQLQQQQQQRSLLRHHKAPVLHPIQQPSQTVPPTVVPRLHTSLQQQQQLQSILQDTTNLQTWARTYMWKECLFLVRLFLAIQAKHADKFTQFVTLNQLQLAKLFISSSAENFWSRVGLPEDADKQVAALEKMKVLFERIKDEGGRAMQRRREQIIKQQQQQQQTTGGGGTGVDGIISAGGGALQPMLPSPPPSKAALNIAEGFAESNQEHPNKGSDHSKDVSAYQAGGFMALLMEDDLEEGDVSEAVLQQAADVEGDADKKELEIMMMKMMGNSNDTSKGVGGSDDMGNEQEIGLALEMIDEITHRPNGTNGTGTEKQQYDVQELVDRWQAYIMEEEEEGKDDVMEVEGGAGGVRDGYRDKVEEECGRIMAVLSSSSSSLISIRVVEGGGGGGRERGVDGSIGDNNSIVVVAEAYIGRDVECGQQLRMRVDSDGGGDNGVLMMAIPVFSLSLSSGRGEGNGSESLAASVKERFREQYYQYREKEVGGRIGIEALVRLWLGV